MARLTVGTTQVLTGETIIPGDKSISHRSIMLGSIARGKTVIKHFLPSDDCLHTMQCFRQLGITIEYTPEQVVVHGRGLLGLTESENVLDVGNSGTTIRLISGILSGQPFSSILNGDESIRRRPMQRVTKPLQQMGARITGRQAANFAPLAIYGGDLQAITYETPVASAQIKSGILLAGLYAPGWTEVREPAQSRNHTELMLTGFQVPVEQGNGWVRVKGQQELQACPINVPGDISSAAFLLVAASIVPDGQLLLKNVGLNPSRTGIIEVLNAMGARIQIENIRTSAGEQFGDISVESRPLQGVSIGGDLIPRLIDEIPILAVAAACARGVTEIRDAAELKVKESNRIATVVAEFSKLGVDIVELPDGLRINGQNALHGAVCESHGDHRIALSLAIAGLVAKGETVINDAECVAVSFPDFHQVLRKLGGEVVLS